MSRDPWLFYGTIVWAIAFASVMTIMIIVP
jgi:hypothetical protein